ncbi:MAG: helix-turn-helix domain-containing protein [archaeon]
MNNIGEKISAIRKYKKISQTDLAQKANLSQAFISHIEQGKRNPTINTIEKIAKGLNLTLKEFLLYIIGDLKTTLLDNKEGQNEIMKKKIKNVKMKLENINQNLKEIKRIKEISKKLDKKITQKYGDMQNQGGKF